MNAQNVTASAIELTTLPPGRVRVRLDDFGKLRLDLGGRHYADVQPLRTHPISAPGRWVALQDADGEEIGMIEDLAELEPETRRVLETELDLRYFTTKVLRIHDVQSRYGVTSWDLETDRGRRTIHVADRGDIRPLRSGHVLLVDMYGMRFDVPRMSALDPQSRLKLEEQL